MGCFNTVTMVCPNCKNLIEIQSKRGSCMLETFDVVDAPMAELAEIIEMSDSNELECEKCSYPVSVRVQKIVTVGAGSSPLEYTEYTGGE